MCLFNLRSQMSDTYKFSLLKQLNTQNFDGKRIISLCCNRQNDEHANQPTSIIVEVPE